MNDYERAGIIRKLHDRELVLLQTKGREYTGGAEEGNERDVLHNFKDVAEQAGVTTVQAWSVYFLKHVSSIMTHIADPSREMSEGISGRIEDARTYLGLLQCILDEEAAVAADADREAGRLHVERLRAAAQQEHRDGMARVATGSDPLPDRAAIVKGDLIVYGDLPPEGYPDHVVEFP